MVAIFYFVLIRPQKRREKERKAMIEAVKVGERVLLTSGIMGEVCTVKEKTLIISSDMDFIQLQKYPGVDQFVPKKKSFLKVDNPVLYLKEHIIRGDKDDGIPNILSNDDVFISGGRQKSIMTAKLQEWVKFPRIEDFCTTEEMVRNYHRNTGLIDLDQIPLDIETSIMDRYQTCEVGNKKKMMDYFYDKGAVNLIQFLGDF
jgi:preprotein translocase YajC subunit